MHAAGAAGAFLTLNDCSSGGGAVEGFYGAPCVDGSCNYAYDSGQTGYEGGGEPFYGGSCVGEECGVAPVPDAGADADAGGEDGPSGDAPGDGTVGDGPTDAGDGG
jgi:hypothetical protein